MEDTMQDTATNVSDACFEGADLRGVDLREVVGLTIDQVRGAIVDETTQLPDYLQQPTS